MSLDSEYSSESCGPPNLSKGFFDSLWPPASARKPGGRFSFRGLDRSAQGVRQRKAPLAFASTLDTLRVQWSGKETEGFGYAKDGKVRKRGAGPSDRGGGGGCGAVSGGAFAHSPHWRLGHCAVHRHGNQRAAQAVCAGGRGTQVHLQAGAQAGDHFAGRIAEHEGYPHRGQAVAGGDVLYAAHLFWRRLPGGAQPGAQLEAEQPDLCGYRHLRRIGHCGHRARDRRAGPRYRLRHVRHLPV